MSSFDVLRSRTTWDRLIRKFGDTALLRQPGQPDRRVSCVKGSFTALERLNSVSNPSDRRMLVSAFAPDTGAVLDPPPSQRETLVTLTNTGAENERLRMVTPVEPVGPSDEALYWKLTVRA